MRDAVFRMRSGGRSLVGIFKSGRVMWISGGYGRVDPRALETLQRLGVHGELVPRGSAPDWKYVPIRRMAVFIESSLDAGIQAAGFEPDGVGLLRRLRSEADAVMHCLFEGGLFHGSREEAYFVKCDAEINSQSDIDQGIVNLLVGFAPVRPAEFVVIAIGHIVGPR
jgi:Bacteriophage tail sheath protein